LLSKAAEQSEEKVFALEPLRRHELCAVCSPKSLLSTALSRPVPRYVYDESFVQGVLRTKD